MLNFAFREEFSIFTFILCRKCKNSANLVGVDFPSQNLILQSSRIRRSIKCSFEGFSEYIILHNYRSELHGNDFIFFNICFFLSSLFLSLSRGVLFERKFCICRTQLLASSLSLLHSSLFSLLHSDTISGEARHTDGEITKALCVNKQNNKTKES